MFITGNNFQYTELKRSGTFARTTAKWGKKRKSHANTNNKNKRERKNYYCYQLLLLIEMMRDQ